MTDQSEPFGPPGLLNADHELLQFDSGVPALDDWLHRRALPNQAMGASRTYVLTTGNQVVGYYALASGAISLAEAPGRFRRNMPDPVPMIVLGRLAIDRQWQGRRIGAALLRDAVERAGEAAKIVGVRGMLVHAISDDALRFYLRHGFAPSALNPMTLVSALAER